MTKKHMKLIVSIIAIVLVVVTTCITIVLANGRYQNKKLFEAIENNNEEIIKLLADN